MNELRRLCDELEDENILGRETTLEEDVFLEYLINNIRNEIVSYQFFIFKKLMKATIILFPKLRV
jgi:hypothetical protein